MRNKRLVAQAALAVAAAALIGVSAFAESRHENETRVRRESGGAIRRERAAERDRRDETRNDAAVRERSRRSSGSSVDVRGSRDTRRDERRSDRGYERRDDRRSDGRNDRNWDRGRSQRNDSYRRHESRSQHRQPHYAHGRVSRVHRHGDGYRVWVHGAHYPFYVPARYYHRDRFRIGLMIRIGGWYNDRGYYDYYDGRRSSAEIYGVVESVDYRRNTFVVSNEATGNFVTVVARGREADRLRAGDYVELDGQWTRSGYFEARDVDIIDSYRR